MTTKIDANHDLEIELEILTSLSRDVIRLGVFSSDLDTPRKIESLRDLARRGLAVWSIARGSYRITEEGLSFLKERT